jgi:hypothetical protein
MTPHEKLTKIKAKCEQLLAMAEKRTPGEWLPATETIWTDSERIAGDMTFDDTQFIASCAGPAEAGWKATIAAIGAYEKLHSIGWGWDGDGGAVAANEDMAESILSAWPDELL